jgi:IS30 family transposase
MTFAERMDLFRLLYIEKQRPAQIALVLGRKASTITREIKKGTNGGAYNPFVSEFLRLKARKQQSPRLKVTHEA